MSSQIVLPDNFLAVVRSGVLNLVDGIRLSDIRWMNPVQIASFDRPPFLSDRLIPFALTAGRSRYGWWRESESCTYKFVVFSPRDCDEAMIYAPDFSAFLYRSILEDLVDCWGSWLDDDSRVDAIVEMARRNVALASPFLPVAWARTLGEVVSRTPRWSATGSMTWIDSAEARDLILKHFGDFAIDTSIIQHHE